MKTVKFLKQTGLILAGIILSAQAFAFTTTVRNTDKNALTLTMNKPVIEYLAKALVNPVDASDIVRMQRMAGQIDNVVVTFRDPEASTYVLKFQDLTEMGLEAWMFSEGYLGEAPDMTGVAADIPSAVAGSHKKTVKNSVTLTVDQPVIEYLARIYADEMDAGDIRRIQKMCCQIDHITVVFKDEEAADYVLKFKQLDKKGLEQWMFDGGYLLSSVAPEDMVIESWMTDSNYLE
jgi:aminoglycoside phosphotransferase family enzyme